LHHYNHLSNFVKKKAIKNQQTKAATSTVIIYLLQIGPERAGIFAQRSKTFSPDMRKNITKKK
jgi:hypothetical protein